MINRLAACLTALGLMSVSPTASALLLADVGPALDTIAGMTNLADNSEATEEAWIESVLGMDINYAKLSEGTSDGSNWEAVTDDGNAGTYAFDFGAGALVTHFLIKIGDGSGTYSDYLYTNNDASRYAYIDISGMGVNWDNVGAISHVSVVPEPGTLSLLGGGLLAMGLAARRRRRRD